MDEKLLDAIQLMAEGKEEGFNIVYSATYNHVYFRAKSYMKSEEDTLDLVQIVYVEAYRNITSLQTPEALYGWLDGITYRQGMKQYRKKKEVLLTEEGEGIFDTLENVDVSSMPEQTTDQKETSKIIRDLMEELPTLQKVALIAYYFDNLSVAQIAEMQECSKGTVQSRLNYGRKYLKDRIEEKERKEGYRLHVFTPATIYFAIKMIANETNMSVQVAQSIYHNTCLAVGTTAQAAVEAAGAAVKVANVLETSESTVEVAEASVKVADALETVESTVEVAETSAKVANVLETVESTVEVAGASVKVANATETAQTAVEVAEAVGKAVNVTETAGQAVGMADTAAKVAGVAQTAGKAVGIGGKIASLSTGMKAVVIAGTLAVGTASVGGMAYVATKSPTQEVVQEADSTSEEAITEFSEENTAQSIEETTSMEEAQEGREEVVHALDKENKEQTSEEMAVPIQLTEVEKMQITDAIAYYDSMVHQLEEDGYVRSVRDYLRYINLGDGTQAMPLGWNSDVVTEETVRAFYEDGFGIDIPDGYSYNDFGVTCNSELMWDVSLDRFRYHNLEIEDNGDGTYTLYGSFYWEAEGESDLYSFEANAVESGNTELFGGLKIVSYVVE